MTKTLFGLPELPPDEIQTSKHHISNSAVALIFRLIGGFFLIETVYAGLFILSLLPMFGQYHEVALRILWLIFTAKFIGESIFFGLLITSWAGNNYYIGDGHLIRYRGIRRRDENVYDLSILKTLELHQGWWGRMFNYGDLRLVFSSSGYSETLVLHAVYNPKRYERALKGRLNVEEPSRVNEPFDSVKITT